MLTRENAKLFVVAAVCLTAAFTVPATAAIVANADKVDGFHAVGAGSTVDARKGALVATSPKTGRLPNNIIATAPDSARLGGTRAADLRTLSLTIPSGSLSGNAENQGGVGASQPGSGWAVSFVVPPEHPVSAPVTLELVYGQLGEAACGWQAETLGAVSTVGGNTLQRNWFVTGTSTVGTVQVPAGSSGVFSHTFELEGTVQPGSAVRFFLTRSLGEADNCGEILWRGALVRY